ncbi:MAG: T9SS type A sorting domain-containing protein [Bacteroidetes bacterium]|nr:T9SS type A sorting domain-containing protein [Bacteroidota bacterium]
MKKLLLVFLSIVFSIPGISQSWDKETKVVSSDRNEHDRMGNAVSVSGNYAIVGAYWEDEDPAGLNTMSAAGASYIFEKNAEGNWLEVQKLVASDRSQRGGGDEFGYSVSISGSYAIVGARYKDEDASGGRYMANAGSAYIFERDQAGVWIEVEKLQPVEEARYNINFGESVCISGNYAIVGASDEPEDAMGEEYKWAAGAAYVFERDISGNWNLVQKLVTSDRTAYDFFGISVAISGSYALVGASNEEEDVAGGNNLNRAGSAYVFERNSGGEWLEKQKIISSDRAANDIFGISVSLSGSYAIVGAHWEDEDALGENSVNAAGSAYIFERDAIGSWNQTQKIVGVDRSGGDVFGEKVCVEGDYAIVGSRVESHDASGENLLRAAGGAHIFKRNEAGIWNHMEKIVPSDREYGDSFGSSVAISGNTALIGATLEDHDLQGGNFMGDAGSAYFYETLSTGIYDDEMISSIVVYPNPTTGIVYIDGGDTSELITITLRNIVGQVIVNRSRMAGKIISIDIPGPRGFYLLEVVTSDQKHKRIRILKQ